MFMAIFPSLEGDSVEDVAARLEERWKVGRKGLSNGVLLVVFLKERKLRIEVGYGLEPVITDAVAAPARAVDLGRSRHRPPVRAVLRRLRRGDLQRPALLAAACRHRGPPRLELPPADLLGRRRRWRRLVGRWRWRRRFLGRRRRQLRRRRRERRLVMFRRRPGWARRAFTEADLDAIAAAVREAERGTSAEIRVHIERRVAHGLRRRTSDAMQRARDVFAALGMHRTAHRSGVLVYLAIEDRKLAIVGDEGIHTRVGDDYWTGVRDRMIERLRAGAVRGAVIGAVAEVGTTLARFFPRGPDDVDELPDDISLGR